MKRLPAYVMFINIMLLVAASYLMFWPVKLAVIYNEPFPVESYEVARGETLYFTIEFSKSRSYRVISHRSIICEDGNLITLSNSYADTNAPVGRHTVTIGILIPEKSSLGKCYIQLENTYEINPLRTEYRTMRTQNFVIIN